MSKFDRAWMERTERDPYNFWIIEALEEGATLMPYDDYETSHRWQLTYPEGKAFSLHVSTLTHLRECGYVNWAYELPTLTEKARGKLEYRRSEGVVAEVPPVDFDFVKELGRKEMLAEVVQLIKQEALEIDLSTLSFPDKNVTRLWAKTVYEHLDVIWKKVEALPSPPPLSAPKGE